MFANSVIPKGPLDAIYVVITGFLDLIVDGIIFIALAVVVFSK